MTRRRNPNAGLRENVREAIDRSFPDGVVEMVFDSDESYFWEVYPKLAAAFRRIKGAEWRAGLARRFRSRRGPPIRPRAIAILSSVLCLPGR